MDSTATPWTTIGWYPTLSSGCHNWQKPITQVATHVDNLFAIFNRQRCFHVQQLYEMSSRLKVFVRSFQSFIDLRRKLLDT